MDNAGVLVFAGRPIPDFEDRVLRYCGLEWSGGPPETWAFRYYDAVQSRRDDVIEPTDVLASAALHPGLLHSDLAFFAEHASVLESWLEPLPRDVDLAQAKDRTVAHVASLSELTNEVGLSLLSKVAHRKRPRLVPLFDRAISDWYRPLTGIRGVAGWPSLVGALRQDLSQMSNRRALTYLFEKLNAEILTVPVPTALRLADIAIWMASVRS